MAGKSTGVNGKPTRNSRQAWPIWLQTFRWLHGRIVDGPRRSTEAQIYSEQEDWWVTDETEPHSSFSYLETTTMPSLMSPTQMQQNGCEALWQPKRRGLGLPGFLYAGAQSGQRQEPVTGMEAYHTGMRLLREAAGDGMFWACGAPMLPSVGYADAFRTGADIGFNFDPGPRHEYLRWQARATASRSLAEWNLVVD